MCLELLLELAAESGDAAPPADGGGAVVADGQRGEQPRSGRGPLLDVGTGSGVLAIAAARLGYGPVVGLDNEPESVAAARENAGVNGVELEARS